MTVLATAVKDMACRVPKQLLHLPLALSLRPYWAVELTTLLAWLVVAVKVVV